jgi:DNA-binding NarL/FixJ family response regulator
VNENRRGANRKRGDLDGNETIRVVVADDQRLFADGISRIISAQPNLEVVAEANDGEEAVRLCREKEPDVVLMDITMPVMDGVTATRKIRDLLPGVAILILTVLADDYNVFQGIKAGAQGYLLKDCSPEDLARAIRSVHAGDIILSPSIARHMLPIFEGPESNQKVAPPLTARELQVIKALAQGKSNKQIARTLGIAEKTVRNHASNIYKKLHIFDRTQAVLYAFREGLVDPHSLDQP